MSEKKFCPQCTKRIDEPSVRSVGLEWVRFQQGLCPKCGATLIRLDTPIRFHSELDLLTRMRNERYTNLFTSVFSVLFLLGIIGTLIYLDRLGKRRIKGEWDKARIADTVQSYRDFLNSPYYIGPEYTQTATTLLDSKLNEHLLTNRVIINIIQDLPQDINLPIKKDLAMICYDMGIENIDIWLEVHGHTMSAMYLSEKARTVRPIKQDQFSPNEIYIGERGERLNPISLDAGERLYGLISIVREETEMVNFPFDYIRNPPERVLLSEQGSVENLYNDNLLPKCRDILLSIQNTKQR